MTLKELKAGEKGVIDDVGGEGALRQHFLDMGIIPGAEIRVVKFAPMGDPVEVQLHGYELTLRLDDAGKIGITKIQEEKKRREDKRRRELEQTGMPHPAFGERSVNRKEEAEAVFGQEHTLTFALVGNQNSGKTTLFNRLTGANQHVGNFPGVTVDRKTGSMLGYKNTLITDLPGIYSMSPYSAEEVVSRNFVLDTKPDAIINIVDATNIERNLYLTMQLLEMGRPMVVALNVMDELEGNGGWVDINQMEEMLGVPVVPIAAIKNEGVDELIEHALYVARHQIPPVKQDFCVKEENEGAMHRCIHGVSALIEDHAERAGLPLRFAVSKVIEGDRLIIEKLAFETNELQLLEHILTQLETERFLDRSAAMADMRFSFIEKVCEESVVKPHESKEHVRSRRIDKVLTGKYTALPIFAGIMGLIFYLTFNVVGAFFQDLLDKGIGVLADLADKGMTAAKVNTVLHDLVINGIFEGVGSVLSFLPIVVVMFFFLSLLEDSGYIARVAFFMDKLLRKIGLSGRSIVPMLIGFGCTVPAVMATRTLPSERDRKMTILLTPFMSCTAKLPIYAFFVSAFFPGQGGLIMTGLYLLGILVGIIIAFLYKKFLFKGEAVPFVMELPNYRLPSLRSTLQLMWEKAKDFIHKAFSVIFIATIVVWFLQSFDLRFNLVSDSADSIMALLSSIFVPLLQPLGLGDWRFITALISGVMAKESVVSVLEVLFGKNGGLANVMTPLAAGTMLIFSLLYTPCVAAVASVRRELGSRTAIIIVVWQCVIAWLLALVFRLLAMPFLG